MGNNVGLAVNIGVGAGVGGAGVGAAVSGAGVGARVGGGVGMGIRKSDAELRDKFTAAIESMKADGTLNALITKWEIGETF